MKTRGLGLLAIALLLLFSFSSCKDNANDDPLLENLCNPTSDHYFRGFVGVSEECWNEGENNFQVYNGWSSETDTNGTSSYYWQPGLDQWPVPDHSNSIFLQVQVPYEIDGCTSEQFHDTFQKGVYSFSAINSNSTEGIEVVYMENGEYFSTASGSQSGSSLQCTGVSDEGSYGNTEALNVTWEFKCKLYRPDGTFYKYIGLAELRVSVLRNKE